MFRLVFGEFFPPRVLLVLNFNNEVASVEKRSAPRIQNSFTCAGYDFHFRLRRSKRRSHWLPFGGKRAVPPWTLVPTICWKLRHSPRTWSVLMLILELFLIISILSSRKKDSNRFGMCWKCQIPFKRVSFKPIVRI